MTTPPSCAPGNVHILSSHSLETDLVLSDGLTYTWTRAHWGLHHGVRDATNKTPGNMKSYVILQVSFTTV